MSSAVTNINAGAVLLSALHGYSIHETDESGSVKYYGYANLPGAWYIMKWNTADNTFRYAHGSSGYAAAWTARASQSYGYSFA